ncbi:MAG: MarR family transcriptional regulator [Firmicutes bacterium]|nr:MarR family transcriptional regulator [Candidatus Fermentithermobacillaceae bacterium]
MPTVPDRLFVQIPSDLVSDEELSPLAKSIYLSISLHKACSMRQLSSASGLSRECVRYLVKKLAAAGWVKIEGKRNRRRITPSLPEKAQRTMIARLKEHRSYVATVGEYLMKRLLDVLVDSDDYVDNARPWFLQNPNTNQFMEYDRFYVSAGVAFEFNGPQHYGTTQVFPDTEEVDEIMQRDKIKADLSESRNIILVAITEEDLSLDKMSKKIPERLPKANYDPDCLYVRALEDMCGEYVANCRKRRAREPVRRKSSGTDE